MKSDSLWLKITDQNNFYRAWERLRANMGAPGIDRTTIADFAAQEEANLTLLQKMVQEEAYAPLPFLTFVQNKNGKQRTLHIPALRDRLVQYAVLQIIEPVLEKLFLPCSYAYRRERSAIKAAERVERWIKKGKKWFYDADIEQFFDSIDRTLLATQLGKYLPEQKLVKLIMLPVHAYATANHAGIPQGMILSPILSNLYLHEFDQSMQSDRHSYLRYSDNLLALCDDEEHASEIWQQVQVQLSALRLALNEKKTSTGPIDAGFVFLGFHFDARGRRPASSSWKQLQDNIQHTLQNSHAYTQTKMTEKLEQIIRGWLNYFQLPDHPESWSTHAAEPSNSFDPIGTIIYRAAVALHKGDFAAAQETLSQCTEPIQSADINWQWGFICQQLGLEAEARDSYISALRENPDQADASLGLGLIYLQEGQYDKAIRFLQKAVSLQPQTAFAHFALGLALQKYNLHGAARKSFLQAAQLDPQLSQLPEASSVEEDQNVKGYSFTQQDIETLQHLFIGREGVFARQWLHDDGRIGYSTHRQPLTTDEWSKHLRGEQTLGLYPVRADQTSFLLVIDLDLSKQVLGEFIHKESDRAAWMDLVLQDAIRLQKQTNQLKMPSYIEDSGSKGLHLWYFFNEPLPANDMGLFCKRLFDLAGRPPEGVSREAFPHKGETASGLGCLIKLPFGIHQSSGRRCLFMEASGKYNASWLYPLPAPERISANAFYEALAKLGAGTSHSPADVENALEIASVQEVLQGCHVLRYLKEKAQKEGRLNHLERLTFLGTLGYMGEDGRNALHAVMRHTINYNFRITDRWSTRLKGNPLSCPKIRQWHQDITPAVGCYCKLAQPEGCYPSPLLHGKSGDYARLLRKQARSQAIVQIEAPLDKDEDRSSGGATLQTPGIHPEGETVVKHAPAVDPKELDALVRQFIKIKKEERQLEGKRQELERRLNQWFENTGCEELPTAFGKLRRVDREHSVSWIIEI